MKKAVIFISDFVLIYLGALSTVMLFTTSFNLPNGHLPLLLIALSLVSCLLFSLPKFRGITVFLCLCLLAFWTYRNYQAIADGLSVLSGIIIQRAIVQFSLGISSPPVSSFSNFAPLLNLISTIISIFLGWTIARSHSGFLSVLATLPLFVLAISVVPNPSYLWVFLIILYWLSVLLPSIVKSVDGELAARVLLAVIPSATLLLILIALVFPESKYKRPKWPDTLYNEIHSRMESYLSIFGLTPINSASSSFVNSGGSTSFNTNVVNLSDVGPTNYRQRVIMTVKTSSPGRKYLRGYSMSRYDNNSWLNDSPVDYSAISPEPPYSSTYRSNTMTIEPLTFVSYANSPDENEPHSFITMEITNISDISGIVYVPYFTRLIPYPEDDSKIPNFIMGTNNFQFNAPVIYSYRELDSDPTRLEASGEIVESEALYRQYVYQTYLNVPDDLANDLRNIAYNQGIDANAGRAEIASAVAEYIRGAARYDLNTPRTPGGEDFVLYFLTQSRQGYCMHFASAATVMLQSLGVPARYVTGYATTISEEAADTTVSVLDSEAHAWVEVYFDGIGWLPYEVTGGTSASPDTLATTSPDTSQYPETTNTPANPSAQPASPPVPDNSEEDSYSERIISKVWLLLLIPLVLAAIIVRRRNEISRRIRLSQSEDTNLAAIEIWIYIEKLIRYGDEPPDELRELALKARFSQHTLTREELDALVNYAQCLAEKVDAGLSQIDKIIFRYIKALY